MKNDDKKRLIYIIFCLEGTGLIIYSSLFSYELGKIVLNLGKWLSESRDIRPS
jgi:hypothetical protein